MASTSKTTFILFILRVIRIFISILTLTLSAKFFGVTVERDVWILVTTFLASLGAAIWGPINETFRAKFVFIKEKNGEEAALSKTGSLVGFVIVVTIVVSVFTALLTTHVAQNILTSPTEKETSLFCCLFLIMLPTFFINQMTTLGISLLNSFEVYYLPEIVGAITGLASLGIIAFLAPSIGIYSLAVSQYISYICLFITCFYFVNKTCPQIKTHILPIKWSLIRDFIIYSLPFFFPYFIGQCNTLGEKWLAGKLGPGIISSLDYSRQFTIVLQNVLSSVLTTIMVPTLAKYFSKNDFRTYQSSLNDFIKTCFLILILTIPMLIGGAAPLCKFFFLRGNMSLNELSVIITLTQLFGMAFIGVILYLIFGMSLLSAAKGKVYAFLGITTQIIVLMLNLCLYRSLTYYIFPVSLFLGHLSAAVIMCRFMPISMNETIKKIGCYLCILTATTALICFFNYSIKLHSTFLQLLFNGILLLLILPLVLKLMKFNIKPIFKGTKK
ncbi:lipid II flippase MurJ [Bacteroides sp. ET225]|uniref:lipid II flippase MurJ n=1 Tax=Bacteroides sp. ET225 TaxID=2972461 RepID=UPI001DA37AEE|nr:lipid II flippase MurJ [Bacteroides sp. ET225]MBW9201241.1 hypothetical protein [Bacteroidales bacterium SW299]MCR8916743.1 hypothetical protein [Bacteroides sp. ET225]